MNTDPILARLSTTLSLPGFDISGAGESLPESIQWMPPGRHQIEAFRAGKPSSVAVRADRATAERMNGHLQAALSLAAQGREDRPFFDFNHEDGAAAAHPMEFYWAGDDKQRGGVRWRLEWIKPGGEAVSGHAFRRFSPTFYADASGEITGAPLNMGGLVNKAAFKTIEAFWSKGTDGLMPVDESILWRQPSAGKPSADDLVDACYRDGRIPGSMRAAWRKRILADPSFFELLLSLTPGRY
jgi:hypothetical protein